MSHQKIKIKINNVKDTMGQQVGAINDDRSLQPQGLHRDKIRQALNKFKRGQELTEIRILRTDQGTVSGYFDNVEALVDQAALYDGKYNTFMTLNQVKSELLDRSPNKLTIHAKQTTSDADIAKIKNILIDVDSMRPTGVSATNKEKAEAKKIAENIKPYLKEHGFPEPFEADSGNGYHLILPVDLENTPENVQLLKKFLEVLSFRFSTNTAEVDRTTYNPARITKLYGTVACKGDNTEERPHRRSELLYAPEQIVAATVEQIKAVADSLPEVCQQIPKANGTKWNIPELIEKHGLDLAFEKKLNGKHTIYVLGTCPWNSEHTNAAAYIIQFDNGAVAAGCHHNSCIGEDWQSLKKQLGESTVMEGLSENPSADKEPAKQSDVILELLSDCTLLHGDDGEEYASVEIDNKLYVYKLKTTKFKQFMLKRYYEAKKTAPGSEAVNQALEILAMKANFSDDEIEINRRVGMSEVGKYYYDLHHDSRYVQMTSTGCSIVTNPDVYFFQPKNMGRQVEPDFNAQPEDLINLIGKHFRIKNDQDVILFASYLVSCLIPGIPHPILILFGEKGSSKSTSMRMLKKIVDPARQDVLAMPSANSDLAVVLTNHYMPCFDNLTYLSVDKSNMLCMAATGGSISKRTL
ncbi:hypothetical protein [Acetobacterium wieringae]|uniref:Uncharacterized protein n=1 Tax=Acetobacterium wieringae TaxID=52694 RepID=A0A1F2PK17_9FIRM|nr:hypothetical protein [Acetobacterium wieringae]OFV71729.1 hypothetical protein ACWI_07790 [Acetobacterium wieringae]